MSATTRCRRCGAPMTWATTENGRPMPVDPYACDDGNVRLEPHKMGGYTAIVMKKADLENPPSGPRYKAHFATCGRPAA